VGGRKFVVEVLRYENGYFVSITEGPEKIGSMMVSIGTGPTPSSATVIPPKTNSLFLKLISERISSEVKGISIVSLYSQKEFDVNVAKALMGEIIELIRN